MGSYFLAFFVFFPLLANSPVPMKDVITSQGWIYSMCLYGMLRHMRTMSSNKALFIDNLGLAIINGLFYSCPLTFFYPLIDLFYRINIYLQKGEPRMYEEHYKEVSGVINYNVLF